MLGVHLNKNVRKKDKKLPTDRTTLCFLIIKSFKTCNHWLTSLILRFVLSFFLCQLSNLLICTKIYSLYIYFNKIKIRKKILKVK